MSSEGGSRIYEVRAQSGNQVRAFGARQTRAEAEELLEDCRNRIGRRNDRYWIEEIDTVGRFKIPSRPTPRERYTTRVESFKKPNTWKTVHVEVLDGDKVVASYDRNYEMHQTFEPFRQGDRMFALVSPDYTATSVLDLETGEIIASEAPDATGFCPVGFYVPDWWDIHDGKELPGSMRWRPVDHEWPGGEFGFVWGCQWGDDSTWKVQYLDLSAIRDGVVWREDRFGRLHLASDPKREARDFIKCKSHGGERQVEFHIRSQHYLATGMPMPDDLEG